MPTNGENLNPRTTLNDDDKDLLREWRTSLVLQDHRYESKALMALAALAMADPDLRSRLIDDTAAVLTDIGEDIDLPDGYEFRFHENSANVVHVVLPPRAGEAGKRPMPLREALRSRTDLVTFSIFTDDFDYPDFHDGPDTPNPANIADPSSRDFF